MRVALCARLHLTWAMFGKVHLLMVRFIKFYLVSDLMSRFLMHCPAVMTYLRVLPKELY